MSAWLTEALYPGCPLARWPFLLLGAVVIVILLLLLRKPKTRAAKKAAILQQRPNMNNTAPVVTAQPPSELPILVDNLQGLGAREDQQDAFGMSSIAEYDEKGILLTLCDGMGGMHAGGEIARKAVADILAAFPFREDKLTDWNKAIGALSRDIRKLYGGQGGTTLVMCYVRCERLWFWCAGDSDLLLLREGRLYSVNVRHEYQNELLSRVLKNELQIEQATGNPQAGALTSYIGGNELRYSFNRIPLSLRRGDKLLLCSDGVTDTLPLMRVEELLRLEPGEALRRMEEDILASNVPTQDNYTAIVLQCNR